MREMKKLSQICEISTGINNREEAIPNGKYPFFVRSKDVLSIDNYSYNEKAVIIPGEGAVGDVFHYIDGKYGLHQRAYRIHPYTNDLNCRYLYYYMFCYFKSYILKKSVGATSLSIRKPMLEQFNVCVPKLKVQEEIVEILDSFTNLIDTLNEELSLRQKQFEYYREKLLTFDDAPSSISKFTKVLRGKRLTTKELSENANYPVYHGGTEPIGYYNEYNREANTVMIINVGASAGTIGFCNQNFWSSDGCYCLSHNQKIDNKFLYYSLLINEYKIKSQVRYAGIPTLDQRVIENIQLFIPSLSIQQSIVEKLDAFESLISSLKEEIALRQKQYEYYREKLLTFN